MPRKAPSPCGAPGCGRVCRERYCDAHAHLAIGWQRSTRASKTLTGRPWRRLRSQILERDQHVCRCDECRRLGRVRPAHEVDHVIPVASGGTDAPSNLRAINRACHAAKTQRESRQG